MALNLLQTIGQIFGASGSNHAPGLVPDPGSSSGTTRFLREDATWQTAGPATPVSVANGGTGDSSLTAYAVLCGGTTTTNPVQPIAGVGTSTQVLTSNGPGALPTFQNAAAGALVLLNTLTASNSASLSDTSSMTGYSSYMLIFTNLIPATTNGNPTLQVHSGGVFQNTSYSNGVFIWANGATTTSGLTTGISLFETAVVNAQPGFSGNLIVSDIANTSTYKQWKGQGLANVSGSATMDGSVFFGAWTGGTGAIDGFQFTYSSGNITSGTIKIYGIT